MPAGCSTAWQTTTRERPGCFPCSSTSAGTDSWFSRLDVPPGSVVLDVCTGTGLVAAEISRRHGCQVIGLDLSERMIARARRGLLAASPTPAVSLVRGRAEGLPISDGSCDAVVFTFLLRYVEDPQTTLGEIARVLRPGGRLGVAGVLRARGTRSPSPVACLYPSGHAAGHEGRVGRLERGESIPGSQHIRVLPKAFSGRPDRHVDPGRYWRGPDQGAVARRRRGDLGSKGGVT